MKNAPSTEELKDIHYKMVVTRELEEVLGAYAKEGKTRGPIHRCDGQEAVGVAACAALRTDDYVCTTHRGHHVYVGKGLSARGIIAEIFGRETGYCKGRGGHMLLGDVSTGMLGGNAIVGAGIRRRRAWRCRSRFSSRIAFPWWCSVMELPRRASAMRR